MLRLVVAVLGATIAAVSWELLQGRRRLDAPTLPLDEVVRLTDWAI